MIERLFQCGPDVISFKLSLIRLLSSVISSNKPDRLPPEQQPYTLKGELYAAA